jgi:hypothetical protein
MPQVNAQPGRVKAGKDVRISGSGFPPGFVKITVNYEHRAESYKAKSWSELDEKEHKTKHEGKDSPHKTGDIDYTIEAYEPGVSPVLVWDGRQRAILAETFFRVSDG